MSVSLDRCVLLWDPRDPTDLEIDPDKFETLGIRTLCVPYEQLTGDNRLRELIREIEAKALVFTRNEDMEGAPAIGRTLAKTGMGYTTVSAIDPAHQKEQTKACVEDFLNQTGAVTLPGLPDKIAPPSGSDKGTFTIIFDMEQMAGVRFGLPRLLEYMEPLGVRATFFVTGFVAAIYPGVLERLSEAGHEIAVHGAMHEFYTGRRLDDQILSLSRHVEQLRNFSTVTGANLIYRMDNSTVRAMAEAGISYFVQFRKHLAYRSRYFEPSTRARIIRAGESGGDVILRPISVETYQGDKKNIIESMDSAWNTADKEGTRHISILMHPFKDGSLKRMELTRAVISHLMGELGLRPTTLDNLPSPRPARADAVGIYYRWDGYPPTNEAASLSRLERYWWAPTEYHSLRTERLADALELAGRDTVMCADKLGAGADVAVFPDSIADSAVGVTADPLCSPKRAARLTHRALTSQGSVNLRPAGWITNPVGCILFHLPRSRRELLIVRDKIVQKIRSFIW